VAEKSTHAEYDAAATEWSRARDVLAGEDAVKAAGERYLPRLDSQSEEEYSAYKARASFFGATARTLQEYLDLVFRHAPAFALCATAGKPNEAMKAFVADCDLWGLDFQRYARRVVGEVLAVGRAGSLVLWDGSGRPFVSLWRAEEIVDWAVERLGDRVCLTRVVLAEDERRRVFRIADGVCFHEWLQKDEGGSWSVMESVPLKREGVALRFIPFVFHGPRDSRPEPTKLPLADIIAANLDHYRLDADYKHGLHFAALPTAWVSGFDRSAALRIGSSTAWVSDLPDASAGFLEFTGAGLAHLERAMEKVERRMALLGARMLEGTSVPANGLTANGGAGADLCGLGSIVASLNQSLSRVLQFAEWWMEGGELESVGGKVSFAMNTDLGARAISGEEITAVVEAWRVGAISRESMLERLKRGEVLPNGRSVAQERALIHGKARREG
jgi:hypothetical protein